MRVQNLVFTALFAFTTFGQAPDQDINRVFHFANAQAPQSRQEILNMIRAIAEIQNATVDNSAGILAVSGTSGQIAMAEWLFYNMDRPANAAPPDPGALQFTVAGATNDVARIFYLTNTPTPQAVQEAINAIRAVTEIQRVVAYNASKAIARRGTVEQMAAIQWLIPLVDRPAGQPSSTHEFAMAGIAPRLGTTSNIMRVFYLQHTETPQAMQEIVNLIRSLGEVQRVVAFNGPKALILRGSADQSALVDWLVQQLDKPPAAAGPNTTVVAYQMAPNPNPYEPPAVRIFYPSHIDSPQALQDVTNMVRAATKIQRAVSYTQTNALALRGTGDQVALAAQILQERDKP